MLAGTVESGFAARKVHDMHQLPHSSGFATRTDIVLSSPGQRQGPQAFLVEQSPNSVAASHFHAEPQFQVVVAGSGRLGRHDLTPYTVHYANRYTGYGPLEAGPQGLSYVTLRATGDMNKPFYLPEAKSQMKPGTRLTLTSEKVLAGGSEPVTEVQCEAIMTPRPDGIGAWIVRVPPNQSVSSPRHAQGGGQFWVVVCGEMGAEGVLLPRLACAFVPEEETVRDIVAGPDGLEVLVLQYAGDQ